MAKNKSFIFLKVSLRYFSLYIFCATFSFQLFAKLEAFSFEKDWATVKEIIEENPCFLLIPEEEGGFDLSREYFRQDFMTTHVTKEENGEITGFVNYTRSPKKYCEFFYSFQNQSEKFHLCQSYKKLHYIHMIAVSRKHTRKGLASKLLKKALSELEGKPIFVDIYEENKGSLAFFKAKGFEFFDLKDFGLEAEKVERSFYMLKR